MGQMMCRMGDGKKSRQVLSDRQLLELPEYLKGQTKFR